MNQVLTEQVYHTYINWQLDKFVTVDATSNSNRISFRHYEWA